MTPRIATDTEQSPDKWAPWNALRCPEAADRYLQETYGITLHQGSTADEIRTAVNYYKRSW
jgi:hypothetical protein